MVVLGESPEEVEEVMDDLLAQGCKDTYYWTNIYNLPTAIIR